MPDSTIEQLEAGDFDQLVRHLDAAYQRSGQRSFAHTLCPISTDPADRLTHRRYVIKRQGTIAASVGVYSYNLHLGGLTLSLAGIGSVSTAVEHRGQGLMSRLMNDVAQRLPAWGYQLAWLVGQRQRYRHFGWEFGGIDYYYEVTTTNLKQNPAAAATPLQLGPLDDWPDLQARLVQLRASRPFRIEREPWPMGRDRRVYAAVDDARQPVGYLVFDRDEQAIVELAGRDHQVEFEMIRAALHGGGRDRVGVHVSPFAVGLHRRLTAEVSYPAIRHSGNWQIVDWQTTLQALLAARHQFHPLLPGRLVIEVPRAARLCLTVDGNGPQVQPTQATPDVVADAACMTQLFVSHVPPMLVTRCPAAAILGAWGPLPLHMPICDRC